VSAPAAVRSGAAPGAGSSGSDAQPDRQQRRSAPEPDGQPAPAGSPRAASRKQRLFIKIAADREQTDVLAKLRQLLAAHAGTLDTVLFYEREQKTIALTDKVRVKPSPALVAEIEALLGKGSAVVR